jgi:hypothetical protein
VAIAASLILVAGRAGKSAAHASALAALPGCGVERWAVKTVSDPDAAQIRLAPRDVAISALRRLPVPRPLTETRTPGAEMTTYRVTARLKEFKLEADGDVHLVIADPTGGGTMIAEFPKLSCTGAAPTKLKKRMLTARAALIRACGQPSTKRFRSLGGLATLEGVGFFDYPHGQRGIAPNAFELHPVLGFRTKTACRSAVRERRRA